AMAPLDLAGRAREQRVVAAHADIGTGVIDRAALAHEDVARQNVLAVVALDAEAPARGVAAVARGAACFLVCHVTLLPQPATMSAMRTTVSNWRWPFLRREFLRRRFLNTRILSPLPWSSTVPVTLAPVTRGAPILAAPSPPTISTSSNETVAPFSAAS